MSNPSKFAAPCDNLREPFFRPGRCNACGWLSELHNPQGWREYHERQASACRTALAGAEMRVVELRDGVRKAEEAAEAFPDLTPFADTGYVSVHEPRRSPTVANPSGNDIN